MIPRIEGTVLAENRPLLDPKALEQLLVASSWITRDSPAAACQSSFTFPPNIHDTTGR
jgi:hypothetical protein